VADLTMDPVQVPALRAVVSGSALGIGRALCARLVADGGQVLGLDLDSHANHGCALACGPSMTAATCDVGDPVHVKSAIDQWVATTGGIDLVVNNAAVWNDTTLLGGPYLSQVAAFHRAIDSCLLGSFHCTAASVAHMPAGSNVVNLISNHIRPHRLLTGVPATGYDAAKFGQWRLTESWGVELAERRIRVNGLAFGATDTPMLRSVAPRLAAAAMQAGDIVQAVLHIVALGADGPTGRLYDIGDTGTPRAESLQQIAAILADQR
jgi:NAD(P)-dependent dehydrogenase (short-subunit alcohol dehydrogenase family)